MKARVYLTQTNGRPIIVAPEHVISVQGTSSPGTCSVLLTGNNTICVTGTPEEVAAEVVAIGRRGDQG